MKIIEEIQIWREKLHNKTAKYINIKNNKVDVFIIKDIYFEKYYDTNLKVYSISLNKELIYDVFTNQEIAKMSNDGFCKSRYFELEIL